MNVQHTDIKGILMKKNEEFRSSRFINTTTYTGIIGQRRHGILYAVYWLIKQVRWPLKSN